MFYKGEIPFVRLLIPLITGISFAYFFSNEMAFRLAIYFAALSLLIMSFLVFNYRTFSVYRYPRISGSLAHLFLFFIGYWLTLHSSQVFDKEHYRFQNSEFFIVEIKSEPGLSNQILRFEVLIKDSYRQEKKDVSEGKLMLAVKIDSVNGKDFNYGDILLIPALYDSIDPPYNPGEFDYRSYLADRQIYFHAFFNETQICIVRRGEGNPIISFAMRLRKRLVKDFYNYLPERDAAAFVSTLILGYRAELSQELIEAYSKTGTMHVLSVSGMHVGIVFMVLSFVLKSMDKTQGTPLIRAIFIISVIWFYALLTGFSAPASRAAVMLSFIVLGKALNRNQNSYNLIAISAFFLLLYNPFYLLDAGFQLSYLAVIGLVYFHPKIYQAIYIKNKGLDYVWSYCALSIAAQLATFPVSVYYFHQFPIYFLLSNLAIVLPIAIIMYTGIIFMFIPYSSVLYYVGKALSWLITFTNNLLYYIENIPYSSWDRIWINVFEYILLYLLIICFTLRIFHGYKGTHVMIPALLIVMFTSFSLKRIGNYKCHELIIYNLKRNMGMAYIYKGQSIIVGDADASGKLAGFSILPSVQSKGSDKEKFFDTDQNFKGSSYYGEQNFYQFANCRVLRWDRNFDSTVFGNKLEVDIVLISGNPRVTVDEIQSCVRFRSIIIGSDNLDYKVDKWSSDSERMGIKYYVLKKNPALIVKL